MEPAVKSPVEDLEETITSLRRQIRDHERRFRLLDTQIQLLERERQKLAALMHHADAGFVVFDDDDKLTWNNAPFTRGFGHDCHPASFIGTSCHQALCDKPSPCEGCPVRQTRATGATTHLEIELTVHGEVRNIYLSAMPVKTMTGKVAEIMVMLQDLSDLELMKRKDSK